MNVTFDFIRENWKPLLKYSFYLILPVCLIQTFAMNKFLGFYLNGLANLRSNTPFNNSMVGFMGNYGVFMLCLLIGSAILTGMVFALMQTYAVREKRLKDVTLNDFKELLVKNAWKYFRLIFALVFLFMLFSFIMGVLAALTSFLSLLITLPVFFAAIFCLIPLMMVFPAYIFERDLTFMEALRKGWKLGFATLGGIIALMIVLFFISSVIQTITSLPWTALLIVNLFFSLTSESVMNQSVIYKFLLYIFGLIQTFGTYISSIIGIIGLAFQYFHAREKIEGVAIESNISNFDNF